MADYVGRFAPTPSGPLHFGSMVAAVGSWLDAKANHGKWLLRIDDLDAPRVAAGSIDSIVRTLEAHGLLWDERIVFQSERFEAYAEAVEQLTKAGKTFSCSCTRKELEGHPIYPGTCRSRTDVPPRTIRMRVPVQRIEWNDRGLGLCSYDVSQVIGDFPLRNAHGVYSYHLANVVDDIAMGVSHVVRGADLELSTVAHACLQSQLEGSAITYHHLPLATDVSGEKLSKQTAAPPVENQDAQSTLNEVLVHLGMQPVPQGNLDEILKSAISQWQVMHALTG